MDDPRITPSGVNSKRISILSTNLPNDLTDISTQTFIQQAVVQAKKGRVSSFNNTSDPDGVHDRDLAYVTYPVDIDVN
eukprot:7923638-Pyramimonas_sp.AAC.1